MAGIAKYTSFFNQQKEIIFNFRELIRLEKEEQKANLEDGKQMAIDASKDNSLEKATVGMDELKLFEYYVEVQLNVIECGEKLTEKYKSKIEEMEKRSAEEKANKGKEEAELRKAEKAKESKQKAFELAKAKMEEEAEANGEPIFDISDEELMEQVELAEEKKAKEKSKSSPKSKTSKEAEKQEVESLFDWFDE